MRDESGWTLSFFRSALADGPYRTILFNTIKLSLTVSAACVLFGYPVAYFLAGRSPRQQRVLLLFIMTPLWVSVLIRTYSWIVLLGRDGLINSLAQALGITSTPMHLLYTRGAVYAAMIQVLLPIAILTMFSSMSAINRSLISAARILGANPLRAFISVFLPLSSGGAVSAAILTFVLALGFFITPALVGGPKDMMISNVIAQQVSETLDWSLASALGMSLLVAGLLIVGAASIMLRRFTQLSSEGGTR
ncbi:ABC transporter permease [Herbaspirillum lusitanum]|uniref:ABC transporter permease n=1 Tax=Herbaspirillum lusitanum TaxID=213312 RepID=A0ABW9ACC8_9BURK